MTANKFQISFQSNIRKVQEVIKEILFFIKDGVDEHDNELFSELRLIFSELLFNAVIHGNKQDINKMVYVEVEIKFGEVCAVIKDEGVGFDYSKVLAKINLSEDLFNENGRGVKLVVSLSDDISFNGCGNEISFKKKVASNG